MSADLLREAAALMRERAEACITWANRHPEESGGHGAWFTPVFIAEAFSKEAFGASTDPILRDGWARDGEHLSSWHPAVALAVADWLDATAAENDSPEDSALGFLNFIGADAHAALAVARAYLNTP